MDTWQIMKAVTHRGHDTEIAAAAAQRPEQLRIGFRIGGNDAAVRQNNLCGKHIVERQAEASDQRSVAAAQGKARSSRRHRPSPPPPRRRTGR